MVCPIAGRLAETGFASSRGLVSTRGSPSNWIGFRAVCGEGDAPDDSFGELADGGLFVELAGLPGRDVGFEGGRCDGGDLQRGQPRRDEVGELLGGVS